MTDPSLFYNRMFPHAKSCKISPLRHCTSHALQIHPADLTGQFWLVGQFWSTGCIFDTAEVKQHYKSYSTDNVLVLSLLFGWDGTCAPPFSFVSSKIILFLLRFSSVRNTCTHTYLQSCQPRIYGKCPNGHLISWMFVPISVTSSQSHFWPWLHPLCSW